MALFSYLKGEGRGMTLLDNRFIQQYLLDAPPHGIAVYLMGLMECQGGEDSPSLEAFSRKLALSLEEVRAAIAHWQKVGLLEVVEGEELFISYLPVKDRVKNQPDAYPYREFNQEILSLFYPKQPTPGDMRRIYDWMDVFGIAQNAISILISYGQSKMKGASRSVSAQINYIHRIAEDWAEEGVLSVQKAESWMKERERVQKGIYKLMGAMGMHRSPTQPEWILFEKWLDMGFTVNGMIAALAQLTGSYAPSFKRLGDILGELKGAEMVATGEINRATRALEDAHQGASSMVTALGLQNPTPTAAQIAGYTQWIKKGFSHEMILYAAECAAAWGNKNLAGMGQVMDRWEKEGIRTLPPAKKEERIWTKKRETAEELFRRMGLIRNVTPAIAEQVASYGETHGIEQEALYLAAEQAQAGDRPYSLFLRILNGWKQAGITSAKEAREYEEKRRETGERREKQEGNRALQYNQRDYTPDELWDLFE